MYTSLHQHDHSLQITKMGMSTSFWKIWSPLWRGLAARKHFGECARTAGEGEEQDIVGKILELSNMIVKN